MLPDSLVEHIATFVGVVLNEITEQMVEESAAYAENELLPEFRSALSLVGVSRLWRACSENLLRRVRAQAAMHRLKLEFVWIFPLANPSTSVHPHADAYVELERFLHSHAQEGEVVLKRCLVESILEMRQRHQTRMSEIATMSRHRLPGVTYIGDRPITQEELAALPDEQ